MPNYTTIFIQIFAFFIYSIGYSQSQSLKYCGIWHSRNIEKNYDFYVVLQSDGTYEGGIGYFISNQKETNCIWTVQNNILHLTEYSPNLMEYDIYTIDLDKNFWNYTINNQHHESHKITKPLIEIKDIRQKVGVFAYINGAEKWCIYDIDGKQTGTLKNAFYFRIVTELKNENDAIYYLIKDYYVNGALQFKGYYKKNYSNSIRPSSILDWALQVHGPCIWYHENGKIEKQGKFQDGYLYGESYEYNEKGKLIKIHLGKPISDYDFYIEDNIIGSRL